MRNDESEVGHADAITSLDAEFGVFLGLISALDRSALDALASLTGGSNESSSSQFALDEMLTELRSDVGGGLVRARTIQSDVERSSEQMLEDMSSRLKETSRMLAEKQTALETVLRDVEQVASRLSLLAVNATIEAAHAGEAGAAFAVVAQEVQRLANQALDQSRRAADLIDISAVLEAQSDAVATSQAAAEKTRAAVGDGFGHITATFERSQSALDGIVRHSETMARSMSAAVGKASGQLDWSTTRSEEALALLEAGDQHGARQGIERLLKRDGIPFQPDFDRLEAIRQRGIIRVAIEPDFVGLSFRTAPGEALQGLDVDYAQALARHLGVRCEFVEAPWDTLTELLHTGPAPANAPADIVLSALPPDGSYREVAWSETYTYLHWVLARRVGDNEVTSPADLDGKTLGIINDPGAYQVLESLGIRWPENESVPGGKVRLKALIGYSDQSRIHDCLADGDVDAFGVDLPIYHWACTDPNSPWHGKIEICSGNIPDVPYYYSVAVLDAPSSASLLAEINTFIADYLQTPEREAIERKWQGVPISHTLSYRDEPGGLKGEADLTGDWRAAA